MLLGERSLEVRSSELGLVDDIMMEEDTMLQGLLQLTGFRWMNTVDYDILMRGLTAKDMT